MDSRSLRGSFSDKHLLEHLIEQEQEQALEQDFLSSSKRMSCCEHSGCLQPCQTGYIRAYFVQNTLESNTDTSAKLPAFPSTLLYTKEILQKDCQGKKGLTVW